MRSNKRAQAAGWFAAMTQMEQMKIPPELPPHPLPNYFKFEDGGDYWLLCCRRCPEKFALKKHNERPGNLLKLLNHGFSHQGNSENPGGARRRAPQPAAPPGKFLRSVTDQAPCDRARSQGAEADCDTGGQL